MIRVIEGYELPFTGGGGTTGTAITADSIIQNSTGTKTARVVGTPVLTGGSWSGNSAAGTLILADVSPVPGNSGAFASSDQLYIGTVRVGTASGAVATTKYNYMRVYYGMTAGQGTEPSTPVQTDNIYIANVRGTLNWPPDDLGSLTALNDCFNVVQWTGLNTGISTMTSSSENNIIIKNNDLSSPAWTTSSTTANFVGPNGVAGGGDGIAIATSSASATSTYYDDFGIQLYLQEGSGFLPPIQQ